jgi:tetratricopeptide (TPR) repeat protein
MSTHRALAVLIALALGAASPAAAATKCRLLKLAELPITMSGASPVVTAKINGGEVRLLADSGAFFSMLTPAAAARVGLRSRPMPVGFSVRGVGGEESMGIGSAKEFSFADLKLGKADFLIGGRNVGNDVDGFLGQNMLGGVEIEYDLANGVLRLFKADHCPTEVIAYWATDKPVGVVPISRMTPSERHIMGSAKVNGQPIRVMFDTGAGRTVLRRQTAERIGIKRDGEGVVSGGLTWGIGRRAAESWIAPVESFELADEKVQHTRLRVADILLDDADMLIGADFFLSHRVMISSTQHRLYFTYNGGPVFRLDRTDEQQTSDDAPKAEPGSPAPVKALADATGTPADASGFSRRGSASMARGDYPSAIADFTKAAELDPKEGRHLYDRATARLGNRQPALAVADLGGALKLKPTYREALLLRGQVYVASREPKLARTDFDTALSQAPTDTGLRIRIADIYVQAGQFETAVADFDQAVAAVPTSEWVADALNGRCWARALWGKELEKALADCDAALKKEPRSPSFLDSRGLVLLRMGRFDEAIDSYDDAIRQQPKTAWSLYGRGLAKQHKGMKAEATADLQKALAIDPGLPAKAKRFGIAD